LADAQQQEREVSCALSSLCPGGEGSDRQCRAV